jgi:hypothetical protein
MEMLPWAIANVSAVRPSKSECATGAPWLMQKVEAHDIILLCGFVQHCLACMI